MFAKKHAYFFQENGERCYRLKYKINKERHTSKNVMKMNIVFLSINEKYPTLKKEKNWCSLKTFQTD